MNPKVSILIPCYNAEQWIAQAIESALNQTYPNKEIIVVDDGSTDSSLEIIKSFGDSIYWETRHNRGGNITRNRLLEISTGEWLQYLDADDYLLPDKIEKQVQFMQEHPDVDIIYSPSILKYVQEDKSFQQMLPIPEPHDPWILLARWYLPQTGSPLWRKQAIIDVGGWKVDQPCCQEHELYFRLLKADKRFQYCPESDSVYRQWSESTVCKKDRTITYRYRLEITDNVESYLKSIERLSVKRLDAINQSRLDCARIIWLFDPAWAKNLIKKINKSGSNNDFDLSRIKMPILYRFIYQLWGFETAETIAKLKRQLATITKR